MTCALCHRDVTAETSTLEADGRIYCHYCNGEVVGYRDLRGGRYYCPDPLCLYEPFRVTDEAGAPVLQPIAHEDAFRPTHDGALAHRADHWVSRRCFACGHPLVDTTPAGVL